MVMDMLTRRANVHMHAHAYICAHARARMRTFPTLIFLHTNNIKLHSVELALVSASTL